MPNDSAIARRIFSGIQPTGLMHVGNYFGAVRNWVALQEDKAAECLYCVVDYHAITVSYERKELAPRSLELTIDLLASGIDPERSTLFLQSQVPEHTELAWVLSSVTSYGDLQRMTQFKDKSSTQEFVSSALLTYPVLMAADILLYKATHVPVGDDQKQHLELTQEIGRRFNFIFGETFPKPEPIWTKATRVMSLADPTKKMSKTGDAKHHIGAFEEPDMVKRKVSGAVTDAGPTPSTTMSPGVANLFLLLEQSAPAATERLMVAYRDGTLKYTDLKEAVAINLLAVLEPLRERRKELSETDARKALERGAEQARPIAKRTMNEVRDRIGLMKMPR